LFFFHGKNQAIQNIRFLFPIVDAVQQVLAMDGQQFEPLSRVALPQKLVDQILRTSRALQIQNHLFYCFHPITP
jgi:hypothetical protein